MAQIVSSTYAPILAPAAPKAGRMSTEKRVMSLAEKPVARCAD